MDPAWLMSLVMVLAIVATLLWALALAVFVAPLRMAVREKALPAAARAMLIAVPVSFVLSSALLPFPDASLPRLLFAPAVACAGSGLVAFVYGQCVRSSGFARAGALCFAVGSGEYALFYLIVEFFGGCP